jgi:acyl-CoA thioesterase-1
MLKINILFLVLVIAGCGESKQTKNQPADTSHKTQSEEEPTELKKVILFFGNSITAGYQLDMDEAFPAIIQRRLDSLGYDYLVVNAGLSGETTSSGKNRIDWVLRTVPNIFVLELGANDGLRGLPIEETRKNLQNIIDKVKKNNPDVKVIIAGMEVPPNLGQDYTQAFRNIFADLAKHNQSELIPFLLDRVAGNPELNLSDGIHPTPEGHQIVAETTWKFLVPLLVKD